jgi:hypothetical protein
VFSIKRFLNSTIFGLTLGILIAGYAVFAYTSPTVAPPGGNVPAPLNVGPAAQVKSGGLWVGSLGVTGGVQVGGRIDATGNICTSGGKCIEELFGRVSILEGQVIGTDTDKDGVADPSDCAPNDNTKFQNLGCYIDNDGDGVRSTYTTTVCSGASCSGSTGSPGTDCNGADGTRWQNLTGYADSDSDGFTLSGGVSVCSGTSLPSTHLSSPSASLDCNDSCSTCYPGSASFTPSPDGRDQDCDAVIDENDSPGAKQCVMSGGNPDVGYVTQRAMNSTCSSYCGSFGGSVTPSGSPSDVTFGFCGDLSFSSCLMSTSGYGCGIPEGHNGDCANGKLCYVRGQGVTCTCNAGYR